MTPCDRDQDTRRIPGKLLCRVSLRRALVALLLAIFGAGNGPAMSQSKVLSDDAEQIFSGHKCEPDTMPMGGKPTPPGTPLDTLPIELEADNVETEGDNVVVLRGRAVVIQGPQSISADELRYLRNEGRVQATGNVVIHTPSGDRIESDGVDIDLDSFTGTVGSTKVKLANRKAKSKRPRQVVVRARATAESTYLEGEDSVRMEGVTYSTCREDQDDVIVSARELRLDQATGVGTARGVGVRLRGVPIFYTPYVTFPLNDERKTGFLAPAIGTAENSGFILQTPWYWNISPERDATITPRLLTDRGFQIAGEYRYLNEKYDGRLRGEFLPDDDVFLDDRTAAAYQHFHQLSDRLTGRVDAQWISDEFYLDDFKNDLNISSATHLPQQGELLYRGDVWNLTGRLIGYQTIDESIAEIDRPYERLPQLLFSTDQFTSNTGLLRYGLEGELVNFQRDAGIEGGRFDVTPYVSMPLREVYGYLTPRLSLRHTSYDLNGVAGGATSPSRTLPIFSVDGGLFFDRESKFAGSNHTQTLEPRLFYVYIPEENQDDIPNFDTALAELNNFSTIFRENRFFGRDRVGDTNQVTAALTTRLIDDETGVERIRASIGQVYFFEDREVTLNVDDEIGDRGSSDFLAEFQASLPSSLRMSGFAQYDTDESTMQTWRLDADYRPTARKRLRLGYIDSLNSTEQIDLTLRWPLNERWDFGLESIYDLVDSRNVATTVRLGYDACCWAVDVGFQRRNDRNEDRRNAFMITLELTGLTRLSTGF